MNLKVLLIVLVAALAVTITVIAGILLAPRLPLISSVSGYYQDVVLQTEFHVTSNWQEVPLAGALRSEKDRQYVAIGVREPLQAFLFDGIGLENGQVAKPEIKLVDSDGIEYPLEYAGARRSGDLEFSNYENEATKGRIIEKVFIRSDLDFLASSINWAGYDAKDLP